MFSTPGRRGAEENTRHHSRSTSIWLRAIEQVLSNPASRRLGVELRISWSRTRSAAVFQRRAAAAPRRIPGITRGPQASGSGRIVKKCEHPASRRLGVELRISWSRTRSAAVFQRRAAEAPRKYQASTSIWVRADREQVLSTPASRRLGVECTKSPGRLTKSAAVFQRRGTAMRPETPSEPQIHSQ